MVDGALKICSATWGDVMLQSRSQAPAVALGNLVHAWPNSIKGAFITYIVKSVKYKRTILAPSFMNNLNNLSF